MLGSRRPRGSHAPARDDRQPRRAVAAGLSNVPSRLLRLLLAMLLCGATVALAPAPVGDAIEAASRPSISAEHLRGLLDQAAGQGTTRVIVGLRGQYQPEGRLPSEAERRSQRQVISRAQSDVLLRLSSVRVSSVQTYQYIPYLALTVDQAGLQTLASDPQVASIQEDRAERVALDVATKTIGADVAWSQGYRGAGQTVAVLDTGVDQDHPMFAGKIVAEACFSAASPAFGIYPICPNGEAKQIGPGAARYCPQVPSDCYHGTHVAGIVAGRAVTLTGVARDATLIPIQVFTHLRNELFCGQGVPECVLTFPSAQIAALEWVYGLRNTYNIVAANLSLGSGRLTSTSECDQFDAARKSMFDLLRSVNIAPIVAAGNDGYPDALMAPGCVSSAISVGAVNYSDEIAPFSNRMYGLSLLAPGSPIYSAVPGGGYGEMHGTSMAAPMVAGAWAIARQRYPSLRVDELLQRFQDTGIPVVDPQTGWAYRRIRLDAVMGQPREPYAVSLVRQEAPTGPLQAGQRAPVRFVLRNDGSQPWLRDIRTPVRLATAGPDDRASAFDQGGRGWIGNNRVELQEAIVFPGENGTFELEVSPPASLPAGTYREHFRLVHDGVAPFADIGLYVDLTVLAPSSGFQAEFVRQGVGGSLRPGQTGTAYFELRNTGSVTWSRTGANPVRLGTAGPFDRSSAFNQGGVGWSGPNRIDMVQSTVSPGEVARFEFTITAPSQPGSYRERFAPVAEGLTWFSDMGLYLDFVVR